MLSIINSNLPGALKSIGHDSEKPFALVESYGPGLSSTVDRFATKYEAVQQLEFRVRRPYAVAMSAAVLLMISGYSASAGVVNISDQWFSISPNSEAGQDLQQAPPNFVNGSALDNGAPVISNGAAFDDTTNSNGQVALDWWTSGNGVNTISGPTPVATTSGSTFDVNSNATSLNPGDYSEVETISFTNALSGAQPLTLQSDASVVMFLNGAEILSEQDTGANYFNSIDEALTPGTNVLQIFAAWKGNQSPQLIVDPTFSVPVVTAPATPEPSTWALCGIGFGVIGLMYRRRSKQARLSSAMVSPAEIETVRLYRRRNPQFQSRWLALGEDGGLARDGSTES
jgi:PEP-CTERM motif